LAGALTGRIGPLPLALGGITLLTYATLELTGISLDEPLPVLTRYLVVLGFGMGLGIMPVMTLALDAIPRELNNQATSILNMLRQVGSSFGIAILATVAETHRAAHYAHLAEKMTITHPAWPELLAASGLSGASTPDSPLLFALAEELQACSAVFALSDAFLVATVFGALAVLAVTMLSFFVKRKDVHSCERNQTFAHF
jgi:MFS family permease